MIVVLMCLVTIRVLPAGATIGILLKIISALFFVYAFNLMIQKIHIQNNFVMKIGEISFELYLIHQLYVVILRDYIQLDFIYVSAVFILNIGSAQILHLLNNKILQLNKRVMKI